MPSFSIPLSGLQANSQDLNAISNNLANLNTVGYKDTRMEFRDLFYQQIGSTGAGEPIEIGAGTGVGSNVGLFTQGSVENSGVSTDMAIQGDGFFVTDKGGLQQYTRAGNFTVDQTGNLVTTDGANVLGYAAVNGVVNTQSPVSAISVPKGQVSPATPTANVQFGLNLDAGAAVGTTFSASTPVYDSLGAPHVLTFDFTKTSANNWGYTVSIPGADVGSATPVTVNTGTLTFNGAGQLTAPAANITGINITGFANGASPLTFAWNGFAAPQTTLTQFAAASAVSNSSQDGSPSGTLVSFTVDQQGVVQGVFSNGQSRAIAQIAMASFANVDGLSSNGGNSYTATIGSGAANIGTAETGGRGEVLGGSLELSNVDISTEFAALIVAQRGYQANAKTVTTFDQVTQDTINLKQ
ncbi:MAG TPA: flagellar hook protein FlgE [Candidatus Angelobacter sp.]|jgi:flagellar hook protein FlgE|nr:flagellar hook protein FlgE [Candidatus Angelobacter sp.]